MAPRKKSKIRSRKPPEDSGFIPHQKGPDPVQSEKSQDHASFSSNDTHPGSMTPRQAMALQTGRVVGNRGLTQMITSLAEQSSPDVQRTLGAQLLISTLASKQAVDNAITSNETLKAMQQEIDNLTPKTDVEDKEGREGGEETDKRRTKLINAIQSLRLRIATEVVSEKLGDNEILAKAIRRRFFIQMARIAPFYTQNWNTNILGTEKKPASKRTCNISTIAMVLEGLGKTAEQFNGNHNLMNAIAAALGKTKAARDLRFPDFMQILAIYMHMPGNRDGLAAMATSNPTRFNELMDAASTTAHGFILSSGNFHRFLAFFDVSIEVVNPDLQKALAVFGSYYRPMKKDFKKYLKNKGKENAGGKEKKKLHADFIKKRKSKYRWRGIRAGKDMAEAQKVVDQTNTEIDTVKAKVKVLENALASPDSSESRSDLERQKTEQESKLRELEAARNTKLDEIAGFRLEQAASEAVSSKTDEDVEVEGVLPVQVYKRTFIPIMEDLLGSGAQVIVVIHNHFVKLQAISEESVIVHDPAGWGQANSVVPWEKARELGYFKRYNIIR